VIFLQRFFANTCPKSFEQGGWCKCRTQIWLQPAMSIPDNGRRCRRWDQKTSWRHFSSVDVAPRKRSCIFFYRNFPERKHCLCRCPADFCLKRVLGLPVRNVNECGRLAFQIYTPTCFEPAEQGVTCCRPKLTCLHCIYIRTISIDFIHKAFWSIFGSYISMYTDE
jgi:hypothetical protein